jgi:hypothetical protein
VLGLCGTKGGFFGKRIEAFPTRSEGLLSSAMFPEIWACSPMDTSAWKSSSKSAKRYFAKVTTANPIRS